MTSNLTKEKLDKIVDMFCQTAFWYTKEKETANIQIINEKGNAFISSFFVRENQGDDIKKIEWEFEQDMEFDLYAFFDGLGMNESDIDYVLYRLGLIDMATTKAYKTIVDNNAANVK